MCVNLSIITRDTIPMLYFLSLFMEDNELWPIALSCLLLFKEFYKHLNYQQVNLIHYDLELSNENPLPCLVTRDTFSFLLSFLANTQYNEAKQQFHNVDTLSKFSPNKK
jgi:hypothetical protein